MPAALHMRLAAYSAFAPLLTAYCLLLYYSLRSAEQPKRAGSYIRSAPGGGGINVEQGGDRDRKSLFRDQGSNLTQLVELGSPIGILASLNRIDDQPGAGVGA